METAKSALALWDEAKSSQLARRVLPILVKQAQAKERITYGDLGKEVKAHHRAIGRALGCVGRALDGLTPKWGTDTKVPPVQCLVVNKNSHFPGHGFDGFMEGEGRNLTKEQRQRRIEEYQSKVFAYSYWPEVLAALRLEPLKEDFSGVIAKATTYRGGGGGEGEEHKRRKKFVAINPREVGLPASLGGEEEFDLPSGDAVDVLFKGRDEWTAVEVKPKQAPEGDIERGIFQCVKYRAVMDAMVSIEQRDVCARAILVLGGALPDKLRLLKQALGVEVLENVIPTIQVDGSTVS